MKFRLRHLLLTFAVVVALMATAQPKLAQSTPAAAPVNLNIGFSTWVGYGPLFVAQTKGYFAEQGLNVTFTKVEDPKDRFAALLSGHLDGLVTTLDTMSQYYNTDAPIQAIFGLDESSGGDGIVANSSISSVKDLKGKNIGVNVGSVSQFLLEYLLQQNGMTDSDVTLVKMAQGDVPAALAANRIDAGVTWEPHLTAAVKAGAKLIANSKETPGLIVDIMVVREDIMKANPTVAPGLVAAWNKAIDYWKANPDDADLIMAKGLGGFYSTADDIKADLAGATLFDADHNNTFFGSTGAGTATSTLQFAIDFYTKLGIITNTPKAADMINASYVVTGPAATMSATMAATASQ